MIIFAGGFPLIALGAHRIVAGTSDAVAAARRSFVFVTAGFFFTALVSFWPFLMPVALAIASRSSSGFSKHKERSCDTRKSEDPARVTRPDGFL
jgi:hypothetical protein